MFRRILGILTLRRSTYLEIAKDRNAIGPAFILTVISSLVYGFIGAAAFAGTWASFWQGKTASVIGGGAAASFSLLADWIVSAVLLVLVARLFKGKATVVEMLRITGFLQVFIIIICLCALVLATLGAGSALEAVVVLIGLLGFGGYAVGVSEAAGITMRKALITALSVGFVGFFAVELITDLIINAFKIPVG